MLGLLRLTRATSTECSLPLLASTSSRSTSRVTTTSVISNRGFATQKPPQSSTDASKSPVATKGRNRRKGVITRRPNISLAQPKPWNRPVREGAIPAYDEALKYVYEDSQSIKSEMKEVGSKIEELRSTVDGTVNADELEDLEQRLSLLSIQSEINLPPVRWKFANGMGNMSKPIYRHLAEQRWRNDGPLDLVMERIYQMNVVPDILPSMHPSFDLRITFPEPPPKNVILRTRVRRRYKRVEPGVFLLAEQTRRPPLLYTSVFHPEIRYYTMFMIDPDVPNPEDNSFTSFLHWLQPNIPLSATSSSPLLPHPHTRYIAPHPQRGSPYHRYTILFLPNPVPTEKVTIPAISDAERLGFNLREFCATHGFNSSEGGAIHMWREVWDETVSQIYTHTLKLPEPRYGLPRHASVYDELKGKKKYTL
ncbi:PEBP-like protein [Rickenella mellea]|uniref:PEBP-like protein n=1 Tax=Rickenella mellea TaxID=50990 RepID=A0A4Y7PR14_9AGAM|nr:PEBP-like protein [Rickenella mellea]